MSHLRQAPRARLVLLLTLVVIGSLGWPAGSVRADVSVPDPPVPEVNVIEDYAHYEPQTTCSPRAKPGTITLGRWTVRSFGGRFGSISRSCGPGTSEHKEGRAFDWTVSVRSGADRMRVRRFLDSLFATDAAGNPHARARRMGVMYVIWNDRIWSAGGGFRSEPYLNSSCRTLRRCSPTLRHLNHVHISITRSAARGLTSWYAGRA